MKSVGCSSASQSSFGSSHSSVESGTTTSLQHGWVPSASQDVS
jgi:hypothetical protein